MLFPAGAIMRPFGIIVSPDLSIVTNRLPAGAVAIHGSVFLLVLQAMEIKKQKRQIMEYLFMSEFFSKDRKPNFYLLMQTLKKQNPPDSRWICKIVNIILVVNGI